jgi:hypothetical protein
MRFDIKTTKTGWIVSVDNTPNSENDGVHARYYE